MSDVVPVLKDEQGQQPVPAVWRNTLSEIVEAFKEGDFALARGLAGVRPISAEDAEGIAENIQDYGAQLISLPEEAWRTSVCQWLGERWDVTVDLFTKEEGASDLILHVRVLEEGSAYIFEIHWVYVP